MVGEELVEFFEEYQEIESGASRSSSFRDFCSILTRVPFIIPFDKRVELFRQLIYRDKLK